MPLTAAQQAVIKADILANSDLNSQPNTPDGAAAIADLYNAAASPDFWVYKTNVPIREVGDNLVGTDLSGLSSLNHTRLQTVVILSSQGVNASLADRRQFFDDVFSGAGGAATRAKLAVLWRRLASRVEKLFATGTGSTASPATLGFEGAVNYVDVMAARNLP